jgi:signal recognition particle receptor subunit beta
MPYISYSNREIAFKVVYYGPGMSGKTTNLVHIHRVLRPEAKGELLTLNTAEERTLFFDFFPVELGEAEGYRVRFNLYTVPGQVYYEASRRLVLEGADGIVFVADSQPSRLEENLQSYRMMLENLTSFGTDLKRFPAVLQYNKRDCDGPLPVGTLERALGLNGIPVLEAVAVNGAGVMETIKRVTRMVIERFEI